MSDDQTRPIEPEAPAPPPAPQQAAVPGDAPGQAQQPAYAMPLPAGYPAYAAAMATPPRPRFADQVMGMRAVVATAIACLIVGGLGGFALGRATGDDGGGRFGPGPGVFQRGTFPRSFPQGQNGFPNQPNGRQLRPSQGPSQGQSQNGR
jgi:hypothetical protein